MFVIVCWFDFSKQLIKSLFTKKEQDAFLLFSQDSSTAIFFRWLHQWTPAETIDLEPWEVTTLHRSPLEVVVIHIGELPGTYQDHRNAT